MKKTVIHENQRGLLFIKGRLSRLLESGTYRETKNKKIEILSLSEPLSSAYCSLETLLSIPEIAASTECAEVPDQFLALHYTDGKFAQVLPAGKYAFWSIYEKHTFRLADISAPETPDDIPPYIFERIPEDYVQKIEIASHQKAGLFFDQKLVRVLEAGTYYFWRNAVRVEAKPADTRLTVIDVSGQELLTRDKVTLRINFVCSYRIIDCIKIFTEIDSYEEQLHLAAQLALREYVSRYRLDEILENRDQLSQYVLAYLKEREESLYVRIEEAGVKDIILPGEIRAIMNEVLAAEKRAQANVIARREEVASTRSLLNTARLMEENQTLYQLKELEYIERICEHVGNINLNAGGDILSQLCSVLKGTEPKG